MKSQLKKKKSKKKTLSSSKVAFTLKIEPQKLKKLKAESRRLQVPCNQLIGLALDNLLNGHEKQLKLLLE